MDNSRKLAIEILVQIIEDKAYSNIILNLKLNKAELNLKDRALVTELVYGTLKYKYTIDKIIQNLSSKKFDSIDKFVLNALRIGIYQLRYLDKVPEFAAVNESVNLTKKYSSIGASKFVNGILRSYLRKKDEEFIKPEDNIGALSFKYSFSKWMVKLFIKQYGESTATYILKGLNQVPAVTVRVNSLKNSYENVLGRLLEADYDAQEGFICPEAIRIVKGRSVESNPLFNEGLITVQDESAMLVAPQMDLYEGAVVLDLCSAPGGKATHISELMGDTGEVYAFDIHENKLSLIEDNAKRLGITNIKCGILDACIFDEKLIDSADRILIDVPCSGLGIIRKKPEIKWTKDLKQLSDITVTQKEIMKNSAAYLKSGGKLIYSTCTLNKEENEDNIKWFLKNFPEFKVEPIYFGKSENLIYNDNGTVTILPNEYMDGFFIAKLKKA